MIKLMMPVIFGIAALLFAATTPTMAEEQQADDLAVQDPAVLCEQLAVEDGVAAEELEAYLDECIANMQAEQEQGQQL